MLHARLSRVLLQRAPASSGVLRCSGPPCSPASRSSCDMCMRMCMLSRATDLPVCACVHPNPNPNPNPNLLPVCRRHRVPHGRAAARRALEGLAPPAPPRRAAGVARAVRKAGHAIGKRPSAPVARALAGRPRAPCGSSYTQYKYGIAHLFVSLRCLKIKSSMRTRFPRRFSPKTRSAHAVWKKERRRKLSARYFRHACASARRKTPWGFWQNTDTCEPSRAALLKETTCGQLGALLAHPT